MEVGQIALVAVAVLIAFYIKGMVGIGGPMIAVPVLAAFAGVEYAVAVIAIPGLLANARLVWSTRSAAEEAGPLLIPLVVAGVVGALVGSWVLTVADDAFLAIALAVVIIAYIVLNLANPGFEISEESGRRFAIPVGLVGGWFQGATGVSAPVFATYLHAANLVRNVFVFSVSLIFSANGLTQVVSLAALGAYDSERLVAGLVSSIPALAVMGPAMKAGESMRVETFRRLVLVVLAISAIVLLYGVIIQPS